MPRTRRPRPFARFDLQRFEDRLAPATLDTFLTRQHVDLNLTFAAGTPPVWNVQPRDDDAGGASFDPDRALLYVGAGGKQARPGGTAFDFIGVPAGADYWRLPQTQDPNLLYLGVAGYGLPAGTFDRYNPSAESGGRVSGVGRWAKLSLAGLAHKNPDGSTGDGQFSVWQSGDSGPTVFHSSAAGGITADDALWVLTGGHTHYNFGFTKPGRYEVTVRPSARQDDGNDATAGAVIDGTPVTLYFSVGSVGRLAVDPASYTVDEAAGSANVIVRRTGGSDGRVTVNYATADGTATAGQDYTATSGTLTFEDGETQKTVSVPVTNDTLEEGDETFTLSLSQPGPAGIADYVSGTEGKSMLGAAVATVTIPANDTPGPNQPPTVSAISNTSTTEDAPASVSFTVGDDQTPAGSLTVTATSDNAALLPAGSLVAGGTGANRTLTLTPAANAFGAATVTVTVADGGGLTATRTFTLTVSPVADAPVVTPATTREDTPTTTGLVITRNPADGSEVTHFLIAGVTGGGLFLPDGTPVQNGQYLTVAQGAAGLRFTPAADRNGLTDPAFGFDVRAALGTTTAGASGAVAGAVTVTPVNDAPTGTVLGNVSVGEGSGAYTQPGFLTGVGPGGGPDEATQTVGVTVVAADPSLFAVQPAVGGDGTLTFTPAAGKAGATTVTLTLTDSGGTADGGVNALTRTFEVGIAANVSPTAGADAFGVTAGGAVRGNVLRNDADADGDPLTAALLAAPTKGAVVVRADGSFTYTPGPLFSGADTFTYTASDGRGGTATGTVTVTGRPADPPFQVELADGDVDVAVAYEDDEFDPHVHDEATDAEYAPADALLRVSRVAATPRPAGAAFDFIGVPAGATIHRLSQTPVGGLLYLGFGAEELEAGVFAGDAVTFRLLAVDGPGELAVWDSTDSGPAVLAATAGGIAGADAFPLAAGSHTHYNWAFTAPGRYAVTVQFSGVLTDGTPVESGEATYFFVVEPPNQLPTAAADEVGVTPGNTARGNLLANDADPDGDPLTAALLAAPTAGTAVVRADGSFTYTPGPGFAGTDTFTYTLGDGFGSSTGSVTVTGRPTPAFTVVLAEGDVDLGIAFEDGAFDPHVHSEETDEEYAPADALLHVRPAGLFARPDGAAFDFLGVPAGTPVYRLTQSPTGGLLFLGFGAEELEAGVFQGDTVTFELVGVDGPGELAVWDSTDAGPVVKAATADGLTAADRFPLAAGSHTHSNWGFTARGLYAVTVRFRGTLLDGTAVESEPATYYLAVDPANAAPAVTVPGPAAVGYQAVAAVPGVSVADPDSGDRPLTLTVTATNGFVAPLVLPGEAGDAAQLRTRTRTGTLAELNQVLAGLRFAADAGYSGPAALTIAVTDGGFLVGAENAQTATATVPLTVAEPPPVPPTVPPVPPTVPPTVPPPVPPTVPPPTTPPPVRDRVAVGSGNGPTAWLYEADRTLRFRVQPFGDAFTGGVRVASADVTGDGVADLIAGAGPGGSPRVVVYDGVTQAVVGDWLAFEASFGGGVFVTAGDLDGDGVAEVVVTPDEGGGPVVAVFTAAGRDRGRFFGIDDPAFRGGARAALADLTGDGRADLVVSAGFGGGPRVAVYDGSTVSGTAVPRKLVGDFFAYEDTLRNGSYPAAGDVTGDGVADLVLGAGPGGGPRVRVLDGRSLLAGREETVANFFAGPEADRGGVRVAAADVTGDGRAELVVGSATTSRMTVYAVAAGGATEVSAMDGFGDGLNGVFVG